MPGLSTIRHRDSNSQRSAEPIECFSVSMPGAMLPIPPGTYDVECKTADGSEFILVKNAFSKRTRIKADHD
jgi:hypothetical protein